MNDYLPILTQLGKDHNVLQLKVESYERSIEQLHTETVQLKALIREMILSHPIRPDLMAQAKKMLR